MKLYSIPTGNLMLDGGAMFGVVPKAIWSKRYHVNENNLCNFAMRSLLIVDGDRKILIDSGVGNKQSDKFFSHYHLNSEDTLVGSLKKYGFTPDDITDHVLTHLHFDHVGGSVFYNKNRELELTFKNATHWISQTQWECANNPNAREKASYPKENILPIQEQGKLKLIEKETEILPNITAKIYDGHTKGQVIPHINHNGKTIAFMADLLPTTVHIPLPYIMSYDTQPLITLKDKEYFLKDAVENNYVLFMQHDLYNECCNLKQTEKGIQLNTTFTLDEYFEDLNSSVFR